MYAIFHFLGFLIRQLALPNPFEPLWPEYAVVLNWVFGGVLLLVSYFVTGIFYHRGENPLLGTVLFNLVYIIITFFIWGILSLIKVVTDNLVIMLIIITSLLLLIILTVVIVRLLRKRGAEQLKQEGNSSGRDSSSI